MLKKLLLTLLFSLSLLAYDFGAVPKVSVIDIPKDRPLMILFGKTECIWCEHMAPYLKEIKEKHPEVEIYYVNTDKDILGAINNNIEALPTSIFWNEKGKESGRIVGYLTPEKIIKALKDYGVLKEESK